MTLDYLAYQTIRACFASRNRSSNDDDSHLSLGPNIAMSDTFLSIFKARHPTFEPDAELRFRILLLQMTTLFTQRLTSNPATPPLSALLELRETNKRRATAWIKSSGDANLLALRTSTLPSEQIISQQELERNRAHVLHLLELPAEDEDSDAAFYGTPTCVSLLDLLPLFMQISAARNAMSGSNLTDRWMRLAGEFMLQACLEQSLVYGGMALERAMAEAFAWGYLGDLEDVDMDGAGQNDDTKDPINIEVNAMFEDEEYTAEVEGWKELRASSMEELQPPLDHTPNSGQDERPSPATHLETIANNHSIAEFESSMLEFLQAISNSIPEPVLVQVEKGQLSGMTKQETSDFLMECGISLATFFRAPVGFKGPPD
ncbi:hypothetical protein BDY17DRAFT_317598 [Neohortaea acidophila]|uniref:Uncharacterized protein n=1 Tax=Neohortaea acidophila TaxID=245834 RepID=A0A6A6PQG0_9PEZI|nr:uncharacterized protein BDY17DRAFT_317598 [Neohortaea acidophila]KAF2481911.1 hypothetical protein BDY17DRAFT_317598 [Neohortaea acidophila]